MTDDGNGGKDNRGSSKNYNCDSDANDDCNDGCPPWNTHKPNDAGGENADSGVGDVVALKALQS